LKDALANIRNLVQVVCKKIEEVDPIAKKSAEEQADPRASLAYLTTTIAQLTESLDETFLKGTGERE
jgi:hypothetical protein